MNFAAMEAVSQSAGISGAVRVLLAEMASVLKTHAMAYASEGPFAIPVTGPASRILVPASTALQV